MRKLRHIELLTLIYSLKRVHFVKGKEIIKKGDCASYFFLLVDGEIELRVSYDLLPIFSSTSRKGREMRFLVFTKLEQ